MDERDANPLQPKAPDQRFTPVHPLDVECLYDDNNKTLMSKGHHDPAAFTAACEVWNGGPMTGWGKVHHVWLRNTPDSSGDYEFRVWPAEPHTRGAYPATMMADVRVWPAEPHTRGAYPATTMVDDPAYDTDAALDNR